MSVTRVAHEAGRARRQEVPRSALGALAARPEGADPVVRLREDTTERIPELAALRFARMCESPLAFLRGAALLMADDLASAPSSGLRVQAAGDAHVKNFGIFASPERRLVFDVTDFDETAPAPFEFDVKRLVTSLAVVAHDSGVSADASEAMVRRTVREYVRAMERFANWGRLEVWYAALDVADAFGELGGFFTDAARRDIADLIGGVSVKSTRRRYADLVDESASGPLLGSDPPRVTRLDDLAPSAPWRRETAEAVLRGYRSTLVSDRCALLDQFELLDVAALVVGVGSVGTEGYAVLLAGRDESDLFALQIKEARRSVLTPADDSDPGARVVAGQRLMQATPDAFLGWQRASTPRGPRSFYVRQLYDRKASVDVERLSPDQLSTYGRACAWVLARAHARSGNAAAITGYLGHGGSFVDALTAFAAAYRDRTVADHAALVAAAAAGRVPVLGGPGS